VGWVSTSNSAGEPGTRTRFLANVATSVKVRKLCTGKSPAVCLVSSLWRAACDRETRVTRLAAQQTGQP
jgi:hypothetical protein